jgi:hypothetical protein
MIILEGPDGAGKTRLAQRLSGDLGLLIQPKVVDSTTQAMVDLKLWVEQDLRQGLKARLYDRHRLISEPIYGPVVRGRMEPGFHDLRWLTTQQWMFELLRPLVIFCLPHIEVVRHNVEDDPENTTVAGQIDLIYWLYHNAASRWPSGHRLVWDYTQDEPTIPGGSAYDILKNNVQHWLWDKGLWKR